MRLDAGAPWKFDPERAKREVAVDLHGYHPDQIDSAFMTTILTQACETGLPFVRFIHGHGKNRDFTLGFVYTNTGLLGLSVRRLLRDDASLRKWIRHTTLDCSHDGSTAVRIRRHEVPTRAKIDTALLPERMFSRE